MAQLIIHRKNQFANGMLSYNVFLNDKKIDSIENGETKKWNLNAGKYAMQARGGFILKTQIVSLNISENDTKILQLGNFGKGYFKTFLKFEELNEQPLKSNI